MAKGHVVDVQCHYYKGGRGRLIKCFLDEISQDRLGLHGLATESRLACPQIGIVRLVRGRPALKLKPGYRQASQNMM